MATRSYITEKDVRDYIMDRAAMDHIVLPDLAFTSEEIMTAMKTAARRYNSIRPYVDYVKPDKLPDNIGLFFDGITAALFETMRINASLNDMDYQAGNVTASVKGVLLKNLAPLIDFYNKRFVEEATQRKLSINLQAAYGQIG